MNKSEPIKGELLRQEAEVILVLVARSIAPMNKQYNVLSATMLLETLLKWHYVPKAQKEKKASMVAWWAIIWEGGLQPPSFQVWKDEDEAKLEELKSMDIDISQTAIGWFKELKKREAFISVRDMNEEEQEKIRRSLDEIDAAAALGNGANTLMKEGAEEGINNGEMGTVSSLAVIYLCNKNSL